MVFFKSTLEIHKVNGIFERYKKYIENEFHASYPRGGIVSAKPSEMSELTSSKCCFNLSKGHRGPDPQHRQLMMRGKVIFLPHSVVAKQQQQQPQSLWSPQEHFITLLKLNFFCHLLHLPCGT